MKKKVVILTGAGISAESGLKTFRDSDGLWENHNVNEVATPEAWEQNQELVLRFYNERRSQLKTAKPNEAHKALVELEQHYAVTIITQNVDDLHERAGSSHVIHLHGELSKVRSTIDEELIYESKGEIKTGDVCEKGSQLRPHIVWFGEMVPMIAVAATEVSKADIAVIIGTSMQVYPAAGLISYAKAGIPVYYIDPNPAISYELRQSKQLKVMAEKATVGVRKLINELLAQAGEPH